MISGALTLFVDAFWTSPFDFSCFVGLTEKGLEFTTVRAMIRSGQNLPQKLVDRAMVPRIPALAHDDFFLSESLAVIEYLEERFPAPGWPRLWPEGMEERARARQVMSYVRSEVASLRIARPSQNIVYRPSRPPAPLEGRAAAEADHLVGFCQRLLRSRDFAVWSIAHADLAFTLLRLIAVGDPVPDDVASFVAEECQRPSVRAYLDHERPPHAPG